MTNCYKQCNNEILNTDGRKIGKYKASPDSINNEYQ